MKVLLIFLVSFSFIQASNPSLDKWVIERNSVFSSNPSLEKWVIERDSVFSSNPSLEKWVIEKNSVFSIEGKSNVAPYLCKTSHYLKNDTILIIRDKNETVPLFFKGGLSLMVKWFDCGQQFMTKEMQKTLKADKRPEMKINLVSVTRFQKEVQVVKGIVEVEIAGISKKMDINFDVKSNSTSLCFVGTKHLKFSDFNLVPPEKLAGLVKVEQDINVKFEINLRNVK